MGKKNEDQSQRILAALKALSADDLTRIATRYFDRMPRKSTWEPPETPSKVEELPPRSSSEVSHVRSHYSNPVRVEGVLVLKLPDNVRSRSTKGVKKAK